MKDPHCQHEFVSPMLDDTLDCCSLLQWMLVGSQEIMNIFQRSTKWSYYVDLALKDYNGLMIINILPFCDLVYTHYKLYILCS